MKIPKKTPRLPFLQNLISWPTAKWRNFITPLKFIGKPSIPGEDSILLDLRDLPGVYIFKQIDDSSIGGLSEGSLDWTENGLEFSGFLDAERAPKMIELPNITYATEFWRAAKPNGNLIRIEARRLPVPDEIDPTEKDQVLPLLLNFRVFNLYTSSIVNLFVRQDD